MSKIWKPLSSFFFGKDAAIEVKLGEEAAEKQDEPETEQDDAGEEPDAEQDEEQEAPEPETEKKPAAAKSVSITKAEYDALKKDSAELKKFGATAKDRANLLTDMGTLKAWYDNAKKAGAAPKADANASKDKEKKQSKITAEAQEAYNKAAARKSKA